MRNFFTCQDDMMKSSNDNDDKDNKDIFLSIIVGLTLLTSPIGWITIGYLFVKQFFNKVLTKI